MVPYSSVGVLPRCVTIDGNDSVNLPIAIVLLKFGQKFANELRRQLPKRFFRKPLKGLRYVPRVLVTDKLKSYAAAKEEIMPGVEHWQHKGINNCAEILHQPTRQRGRQMRRFKSPGHAQCFLSALGRSTTRFGVTGIACGLNSIISSAIRHSLFGMRSPV